MERLASIITGISLVVIGLAATVPVQTQAHYWNISQYDAITGVNKQILDGTIHARVVKQYMTIGTQAQLWIDASMNVLTTKYAPACLAAGCATK
ncbi:hypothetical protein [Caudoviricetes sp.]|nr:hypothetical protein [Caudoviricetes sp.]